MQRALEAAKEALYADEVPVGAILVHSGSGKIIASHGNKTRILCDPTAHAEILCIREGCKQENAQRLPEYDLYVTLEPCAMCAAALSFARIRRVIFGASDIKGGGVLHGGRFYEQPTCHHRPQVTYGIMEPECSALLKDFFKKKRRI